MARRSLLTIHDSATKPYTLSLRTVCRFTLPDKGGMVGIVQYIGWVSLHHLCLRDN